MLDKQVEQIKQSPSLFFTPNVNKTSTGRERFYHLALIVLAARLLLLAVSYFVCLLLMKLTYETNMCHIHYNYVPTNAPV